MEKEQLMQMTNFVNSYISNLNSEKIKAALDTNRREKRYKFFYISDLHLDHSHDNKVACMPSDEMLKEQTKNLSNSCKYDTEHEIPCLFILGDIAENLEIIFKFLVFLRKEFLGEIFFVPGNHEYYVAARKPFEWLAMVNTLKTMRIKVGSNYWGITEDNRIESLSSSSKNYKCLIMTGTGASPKKLKWSLTGIAHCEQKRADFLANRYEVIIDYAEKCCVPLIIASHYPIEEWYEKSYKVSKNIYYLSGHTHFNKLYKENNYYANNQIGVGYNNINLYATSLIIGEYVHPFFDFEDGLYTIDKDEYWTFMLSNGIMMKRPEPKFEATFYMIKRQSYYLFMRETKKSLCFLYGGKTKKAKYSLDYYYDHLIEQGDFQTIKIKSQVYDRMKNISEWVKSWGGDGWIHGAIIDIDRYNHLFINPLDGTVMPYYSPDIVSGKILRYAYSSVDKLLTAQKRDLLENFDKQKKNELALITSYSIVPYEKFLVDDKLNSFMEYKINRQFSHKINRAIETNIISVWYDEIFKPEEIKAIEKKEN